MNATKLCHSTGKHWKNFARQRMTKEFLEYLQPRFQHIPIQEDEDKVIWVDYNIAERLAGWCRPEFSVALSSALMYRMCQERSGSVEDAMLHDPAFSVAVPRLASQLLRGEIVL
jgi:hypothetical protein